MTASSRRSTLRRRFGSTVAKKTCRNHRRSMWRRTRKKTTVLQTRTDISVLVKTSWEEWDWIICVSQCCSFVMKYKMTDVFVYLFGSWLLLYYIKYFTDFAKCLDIQFKVFNYKSIYIYIYIHQGHIKLIDTLTHTRVGGGCMCARTRVCVCVRAHILLVLIQLWFFSFWKNFFCPPNIAF